MNPLEIGVCTWSIDRRSPLDSIRVAAQELHVRVVHLGFFDEQTLAATGAADIKTACADYDVEISATFAAFPGEDYSSIEAIAKSGGYLPDDAFPARREMTHRVADLNAALGVTLVAIHAGTVPRDPASDDYQKLAERTAGVADDLRRRGISLLLETGRESAQDLLRFLDEMNRPNIAVNLDPGNLVIYGTDDPVTAVRTLRGLIAHAHLKDANPSDAPGQTFGAEGTLGTGQANIPRVVSKLRAAGYAGPLIVERTSGRGDPGTLADSVDYLRSLLQ